MRLEPLARAAARPPLVGAVYVLVLAAWAARSPTVDARTGGAEVDKLESFVRTRFAGEITRMGVAILATSLALGVAIGGGAWLLAGLRDALRPPPRARGPVRDAMLSLALVVTLHASLELWAMARDPALYQGAWYAHGGWRRTVQVLATDVLGPGGIVAIALACALFFVLGPPDRWRSALGRARELARRFAPPAAAASMTALAAWVLSNVPGARAAADARPNVLVIAADSLRADRLDPRVAPHLTALAARATRFDRAYVSIPRTFPSWVTLLTGRHSHHHGIRSMFPRWEDRTRDFDALPERLARAGYATGVVSDYAGDVFSRIDLGFERVDVPEFDFRQLVRQQALERETPLLAVLHSRPGRSAFPVMRELNDAADPSMLARDAVRAMRALEDRGPFFLTVFFSTAHFPYAAPAPYYGMFTDPTYRGRFKYDKPVGLGDDAPADDRDAAQVRALYDGAVRSIDDAAQTILDALSRDGLSSSTIVVVTADHGETLFEHGRGVGHGDHLFGDEGTHVPLVVADPRHPTPRREPAIVRDVDLAPTLYALTGVAPPADEDGVSLAPALDGRPLPAQRAYAETELWFTETIPGLPASMRLPYPNVARLTEVDDAHGDEVVLRKSMTPLTLVARHRMVRDDRWKLVYVPTRAGVRWMLFDTQTDPGETTDVATAHPEVVARLQGDLWAWMRQDAAMTERNGYLVPRESHGDEGSGAAFRIEDAAP
jgi:arylsulfatase A-like enzyme